MKTAPSPESMRDHFAQAALSASMARIATIPSPTDADWEREIRLAFRVADLALIVREERPAADPPDEETKQ